MARYFLHLRDDDGVVLDEDGIECVDLATLARKMQHAARHMMGHDVMEGRLHLGCEIEAVDEAGTIACRLRFADAITIVQPL